MSAAELDQWRAFAEVDGPFLPQRLDVHCGIEAAAARGALGRMPDPKDYTLLWEPPKQVKFSEGAAAFAAIVNAKNKRK